MAFRASAFGAERVLRKSNIKRSIFAVIIAGLFASNHCYAETNLRIGTLIESRHYNPDDELNNRHNGLYVAYGKNVFGTFYNSEHKQSLFYARNYPINEIFSYSFGIATGYNIGALPILGLSAQLSIFKITFTPEAAVFGLEFSI